MVIKKVIQNRADHWQYSIPMLWNETYVKSLEQLLKDKRVRKVLDPACGVGFPALDLAERGFEVTASDGDPVMLENFKQETEMRKRDIIPQQTDWRMLSSQYKNEFDAVIVRGNSLVYVDSWAVEQRKPINVEKTDKGIQESLANFRAVLKPKGILYVDIFHRFETQGLETMGSKTIDGLDFSLDFDVAYEKKNGIRRIVSKLYYGRKQHSRVYTSFLLPHERLVYLLKHVGFKEVEPYVPIDGENVYSVFIARK